MCVCVCARLCVSMCVCVSVMCGMCVGWKDQLLYRNGSIAVLTLNEEREPRTK